MSRIHFTDVVISRLKEVGEYHDATTLGFAIRVGKNRKTWFVIRGRERLRTHIGRYPDVSLADARKEAKRLLSSEPEARSITFDDAYDAYKPILATKKPRTQRDYKRMIEVHLQPTLGRKRLSEITYDDVMHSAASPEKRNILAVARTFFRWCVRPPRRYLPHSPLEGLEVPRARKRKRVLNAEELRQVWRAAGEQAYPHGTIVQLLALTGQRRGEIANLRWPWINEKERTITLPEWLSKNKKEHVFPYNGAVAAVLETIPRRNTTDLLFPSKASEDRPVSGWSKFKKELTDGVPDWRLHDLRRTFRTVHAELGTPAAIAERLINHAAAVQTDVEEIYDRYAYLKEMRAAAERFEQHVLKMVAPA